MPKYSVVQEGFLTRLQSLQPDLCVTAAYGNILPKAFLAIPKFGTLNIHPSLLPKYRGAAPVQRCLQVSPLSVNFAERSLGSLLALFASSKLPGTTLD